MASQLKTERRCWALCHCIVEVSMNKITLWIGVHVDNLTAEWVIFASNAPFPLNAMVTENKSRVY